MIHQNLLPLASHQLLPLPTRLNADTIHTGLGTCIAMVDSDFVAHPDLTEPSNRIAGYYDAVNDKLYKTVPAAEVTPRSWHGTMTACTAAGNGYLSHGTYTSLAPDAKVFLVRTMNDKGRVTTETLSRALTAILRHSEGFGIDVVNISVYADEIDHTVSHPVNRCVEDLIAKGIVVVAAVGNNPMTPIRPPAAAPNCIAVGGLDDKNSVAADDNEMYHSTFGTTTLGVQKPELIAPAIWLPAPILLGTTQFEEASALCALDAMTDAMLVNAAPSLMPYTKIAYAIWTSREISKLRHAIARRIESELILNKYYKMVDGTSFAAPIVTSIVAQMKQLDRRATPREIKDVLTQTARPLPDVSRLIQGFGVVQQREALSRLRLIRSSSMSN